MDPLDFRGKTVLVVGGSSGIGNGIAHAFRKRGATVHVWGTRPDAEAYRGVDGSDLDGLEYSSVDVGDADAIERWSPPFTKLDVLVQSQGIVVYGKGEFEPDGWDKVMSVNLDSLMLVARKFRGALAADGGGAMVIVSSISGFQANIGNPAYSASKAGAISLTRVLAKAWAREGIRVNGIAPGFVATKLTAVTANHPQRMENALAAIPRGRVGSADDMGNAALFLASPLADYVAGHTIVVDGGLSLS